MKRLTLTFGLVALAAVLAACSGASAGTAAPAGSVDPNAIVISAKDLTFNPTEVSAPADTAFEIVFDNQEGAPHNMKISDSTGAEVFKGEVVTNQKVTYSVPALAAGSYPFICEVHPDMKGNITAE
jgi:plastocyanin